MEKDRERSQTTIRRIEQNDPIMKELHIGSNDFDYAGHDVGVFLSHNCADFARLGEAVENNIHLETMQYFKAPL